MRLVRIKKEQKNHAINLIIFFTIGFFLNGPFPKFVGQSHVNFIAKYFVDNCVNATQIAKSHTSTKQVYLNF